jgi:hypothetical protein
MTDAIEVRRTLVKMESAQQPFLADYVTKNGQHDLPILPECSGLGKKLVICGAGPSLDTPEARHELEINIGHVWACNSALDWLLAHGQRVTHAITIDAGHWWEQTPGGIHYVLASVTNPKLVDHLVARGRRVSFIHSFMNFPGEVTLYRQFWGKAPCLGHGMTVVPRVLNLAIGWCGYQKVVLLGADSAVADDDGRFHAGRLDEPEDNASNRLFMEGVVHGRTWHTTPEFLLQAVMLVQDQRALGSRLKIVGDTLPNALSDYSYADLDLVGRPENPGGVQGADGGIVVKGTHVVSDVFYAVTRTRETPADADAA